ncbi:MAG: hypothetical protein U9Q63_03595 [Patescibacteria group bacterium]|nr:hypothetical protein [Patescibacteria group bacterium]
MNNSIKFVYFDVGGVLYLDYSKTNKWEEMQHDLGITQKKSSKFNQLWKKHASRVCLDYDVNNLIPILKKELNLNIPKNYSMLKDFINRFDKNPSIWPVAKYAKKHYKVGLLTNQYPRMLPLIMQGKQIPNVEWDIVIDSSIVGLQKPDPNIFKLSQKRAKTKSKYIFYIDNDQKHLDSAKNLGWQTFLYDPSNPLKSSKKLLDFLKN